MGIGMTKVLHVKIPVTDLQCSASWYAALMDLKLSREFIEDGELRGAALYSPEAGFAIRATTPRSLREQADVGRVRRGRVAHALAPRPRRAP